MSGPRDALIQGTMADLAVAWSGNRWDAIWVGALESDVATRPSNVATALFDETGVFPISWDNWAQIVPAASITP